MKQYYNEKDLTRFGIRLVGKNVLLHTSCNVIGYENIWIGDNVRIDGFCTIIANGPMPLNIGSYVHIGGYCLLIAGAGIDICDFVAVSWGCKLFSKSDDYSGHSMTNPTVPEEYTNVKKGAITLNKHVIIGSSSVILPNITIGEGTAVGAQSLITKNLKPWKIYFGAPARILKSRSKELLKKEKALKEAS